MAEQNHKTVSWLYLRCLLYILVVLKQWFILQITPTLPQHSHCCDSLMFPSSAENQHIIIFHLSNRNLESLIYYAIIYWFSAVGDTELAIFCPLLSPLILSPAPNMLISYFRLDNISLHVNAFLSWAMPYALDTFLFCSIISFL